MPYAPAAHGISVCSHHQGKSFISTWRYTASMPRASWIRLRSSGVIPSSASRTFVERNSSGVLAAMQREGGF